SASSRMCSSIASTTGVGMSAAPALLRWFRCAHPGVSARRRARSGKVDGDRVSIVLVRLAVMISRSWAFLTTDLYLPHDSESSLGRQSTLSSRGGSDEE